MSTQGRKGAWKFKRPKKFMRTFGFLLLHMYTSIMVNAWPKNTRFTNVPNIVMRRPPKRNIKTKSAVLPLKEPSSNIRQYRYKNIMLNKKLNPTGPKNRKLVINRHT